MTKALAGAAEKAGPKLVTRRDLAGILHVHVMTITKWEQSGMPIARRGRKGKPSKYREVDVRAWLQQREEAAQKSGGPVNLVADRARRERARAILDEQTYAVRAGELLRRDEVEKAWLAEVTAVRAKLLSWPTTLADRLHRVATLEGVVGVERALTDAVHQTLRELAEPPKPAPRPRRRKRQPVQVILPVAEGASVS